MADNAGGGLAQLHDELRTAIIQGRIPPGTRMSQVQLAGELSNRMVTVTGLSVDDLEAIYVLRILTRPSPRRSPFRG